MLKTTQSHYSDSVHPRQLLWNLVSLAAYATKEIGLIIQNILEPHTTP